MERSALVDIHDVDVDIWRSQQGLEDLDLVVAVVLHLVLLYADEAVEDGGAAVLVQTVHVYSVCCTFQQFSADLGGVIEVFSN